MTNIPESFDHRNKQKQLLDQQRVEVYAKPRQVRLAYLGRNIWFEQDGKGDFFIRPILIMKKVGNLYLVLPMTTKGKDSKYYYRLPDELFAKQSRVILSQLRVIDTRRLLEKKATVGQGSFEEVKEKLRALML